MGCVYDTDCGDGNRCSAGECLQLISVGTAPCPCTSTHAARPCINSDDWGGIMSTCNATGSHRIDVLCEGESRPPRVQTRG
ncbi:MAG: hypothetical protein OEZ06_09685 [Myxococcales bacterium]|nr:hypothetical protein [Myxococcales bacterium]